MNITYKYRNTNLWVRDRTKVLYILYHTKIRQISVCLSVCPSVRLYFDFHENRSHGELHARPMCCSELDDGQYDLNFYGCGQIIQLNDFCVVFANAFFATVVQRLWRPRATVLNAIVSSWSQLHAVLTIAITGEAR